MEKNYNLTDIGNEISNALDTPTAQTIRTGAVGALGVLNPALGVVAGVGNNILSEINTFKLSRLLDGLSSGLNIEMRLNQLYNYVKSSPTKAITVANLFRQTINAETPKVCVLYGLILAGHLENKSEFSHDELIVCKALENATDYDLNNFKDIMEHYLVKKEDSQKITFPKNMDRVHEFESTCHWCVYNRIFISRGAEWNNFGEDDGVLDLGANYYTTTAADILLKHIMDARQTWSYGA